MVGGRRRTMGRKEINNSWRATNRFTSPAGGDANLHLQVLYFTSPGGGDVFFFASTSSVGAAFLGLEHAKDSYFCIYIFY